MSFWAGRQVDQDRKNQGRQRHYTRSVTEDQFDKAAGLSGEKAARNPAQQGAENARNGSQPVQVPNEESPVLLGLASACENLQVAGAYSDPWNIKALLGAAVRAAFKRAA